MPLFTQWRLLARADNAAIRRSVRNRIATMAAAENTAEVTPGTAPAAADSRLQQTLQNLNALSQRQKIAGAAAPALVLALLAGALLWTRAREDGVLSSNLAARDGGEMIAALGKQNVPARMPANASAILAPRAQVHETRLRPAAQRLRKGGLAGFELMDGQKLGISQFN